MWQRINYVDYSDLTPSGQPERWVFVCRRCGDDQQNFTRRFIFCIDRQGRVFLGGALRHGDPVTRRGTLGSLGDHPDVEVVRLTTTSAH